MTAALIARRNGLRSLVFIRNQVRDMSKQVQPNVNRRKAFLLDTLSFVRRLEEHGVPSKQAEAFSSVITEVLNDKLKEVSQSFVSNEKMRISKMVQDAYILKIKYEMESSQNHHFSSLQHEIDKLRVEKEKMRDELRLEMHSGFKEVKEAIKLDIKEVHAVMHSGFQEVHALKTQLPAIKLDIQEAIKLDIQEVHALMQSRSKEVHDLKSQLSTFKLDIIKYIIGTLISISAAGAAVFRIWMPGH